MRRIFFSQEWPRKSHFFDCSTLLKGIYFQMGLSVGHFLTNSVKEFLYLSGVKQHTKLYTENERQSMVEQKFDLCGITNILRKKNYNSSKAKNITQWISHILATISLKNLCQNIHS